MINIFREDTQWAIAGNVSTTALEQLACRLPRELQGDGSKVVEGKQGFAALLVFGDVPDEALAKQLLAFVSPVYLLDFDDEAPVIVKFDRKKTRVIETRIDEHPADFLEERGIVAPGYAFTPSPIAAVGLVEGTTPEEAKRALPSAEVEFREHPRGVLIVNDESGMVAGWLSKSLGRRAYMVLRNPEDGWFACTLCEPGQEAVAYSPVRPNPNRPPIDNILGETTLEGILRVLAIPRELVGLPADE
jgi:hypothetical protein